ncbi:MAG: class I SAM-dependent methyltransferase [Oceanipulchritudo sp.]
MSGYRRQWEEGLRDEVAYWEDWLEGRTPYAEERALRLSSDRPFPWWAKPLIRGNPREFRVLDVGAGPVTDIGTRWGNKDITIVPVDPLAREFAELLRRHSVVPVIPTVHGLGEELVQAFGEASFDFAYACNSLDRSMDPVECYRQMIAVLKPGCSLVTLHEANQGEKQNYTGVHQWNFSLREDRLIVWNHNGAWDILDSCEHIANSRIQSEEGFIRLTLTRQS